jgi:SAM-dependent methyltransferase
MDVANSDFLNKVERYYSEKIRLHGDTPNGVDWNGTESQELRFQQLCKILPKNNEYTLNDIGCGYGALLDYLRERNEPLRYIGVDISKEMITTAMHRHSAAKNAKFLSQLPDEITDYSLASGIFNVRLDHNDSEWLDYIKQTLDVLDQTSSLGFAFNCLTSYSDEDKKRDYLYYADPCQMFDLCKCLYSKQVALLHDYGLYEFTILVKKV